MAQLYATGADAPAKPSSEERVFELIERHAKWWRRSTVTPTELGKEINERSGLEEPAIITRLKSMRFSPAHSICFG